MSMVEWLRGVPALDRVPMVMFPATRRLVSELRTFRHEFEGLQHARAGKAPGWVRDVRKLIEESERAWRRGNLDLAWREFRGARRLAILGYPKARLENEASALMHRSEILPPHVQKAMKAHLRGATTAEGLMRATMIRDEHFDDKFHGINLLHWQLWVILGITFGVLASFLLLAWAGEFDVASELDPSQVGQLLAMILAGMLGGSLSALRSLMSVDEKSDIPERVVILRSTLLRSLLGGAAALAMLFLLESGLFGGGPTLLGGMLAVAFAGGFTERLVMNAATSVAERVGAKAKA
jgi:hypothetical protein